jgi:hypothetical protein
MDLVRQHGRVIAVRAAALGRGDFTIALRSAIAGLGVVGGGAEYVGAQVVARDCPLSGVFDCEASRWRHSASAPVGDVLRANPEATRQLGLRLGLYGRDGPVDS